MDLFVLANLAVVLATLFLCVCSFSLRSFSRVRLEDFFDARTESQQQLERLETHLPSLQLTFSLLAAGGTIASFWTMMVRLDGYPLPARLLISAGVVALVCIAIPHAWSRYAAEHIIKTTLPLLLVMRHVFAPISWLLNLVDVPIRRLTGTVESDEEERNEEAKQEILQAAAEGQAEGAVDAQEVEMLESVLEFSDTDAAEIMTPRTDMFALSADLGWDEITQQIHKAGHTRVPIYEGNLDTIIGMIYAKDLLQYMNLPHPANLADVLRKPYFVPETKTLDDLLREFKSRKVHVAIVLDEYGGTAGLVTIEDVVEEIVGDIHDEYDQAEVRQVRRINERSAEVDGRLRIDELNDVLDLNLPEDEDYDTVAGYAVTQFGYIPARDDTFSDDNVTMTVLEADERKIIRLRVERMDDETESDA